MAWYLTFLVLSDILFFWKYHSLFFHLPTKGHLCILTFWKLWIKLHKYPCRFLCGQAFSILWNMISRLYGQICLTSWETTKLTSKVAAPFCIPTNSMWEPLLFCILASIYYRQLSLSLLGVGRECHSNRCVVGFLMCLFHFPDGIWFGASFHRLICRLYICFGDMSIKFLVPFVHWVVHFLSVVFQNPSYILEIVFSKMCRLQMFSPSGLSFRFLHIFCRADVFNFNEVQFVNSQDETVGWNHDSMNMSLSKEMAKERRWWSTGKPGMLQSMGSQTVRLSCWTTMLSSRDFIVLCFTSRSIIHFELFCKECKLVFLHADVRLFQYHLL